MVQGAESWGEKKGHMIKNLRRQTAEGKNACDNTTPDLLISFPGSFFLSRASRKEQSNLRVCWPLLYSPG